MKFFEIYLDWYNNYRGKYSWIEYYNLIYTKRWKRESKQRNYKRNDDIIYSSNASKRNDREVGIEIINNGNLYLDGQYLKYSYTDAGFNSDFNVDKIDPMKFLTMWVDNELNLVADIPNLMLDKSFFIDYNAWGNLLLTDTPTKPT